jgi:hypothetical protein
MARRLAKYFPSIEARVKAIMPSDAARPMALFDIASIQWAVQPDEAALQAWQTLLDAKQNKHTH